MTLPVALLPAPVTAETYVMPGEVKVAVLPTRFLTILGSCISICLYDRGTGIGGLNHFLLPGTPGAGEREALRWSSAATDALFAAVLAAGAAPARLEAKVFGGASINPHVVPASLRIGARNLECALAELARRRVPVMNQDVGGLTGRKLVFESHTGMAWVKNLARAGQ
jgi:chemotaxis protein CheD